MRSQNYRSDILEDIRTNNKKRLRKNACLRNDDQSKKKNKFQFEFEMSSFVSFSFLKQSSELKIRSEDYRNSPLVS